MTAVWSANPCITWPSWAAESARGLSSAVGWLACCLLIIFPQLTLFLNLEVCDSHVIFSVRYLLSWRFHAQTQGSQSCWLLSVPCWPSFWLLCELFLHLRWNRFPLPGISKEPFPPVLAWLWIPSPMAALSSSGSNLQQRSQWPLTRMWQC